MATTNPAGQIDVVILGSTGSIGTQALEVVSAHRHRFNVVALSAGGARIGALARQVLHFRPQIVGVETTAFGSRGDARGPSSDADQWQALEKAVREVGAELLVGEGSSATIAGAFPSGPSSATVLNGITGGTGLSSTLAALESGATLALANKESLVVGGAVVKRAVQYPGQVVPVDSEHSAIAQALLAGCHQRGMVARPGPSGPAQDGGGQGSPAQDGSGQGGSERRGDGNSRAGAAQCRPGRSDLHSLVLTASGGPFRGMKRNELRDVTAAQALAHPTWSMGPVVTVNSSTLMNKGLELIEASLLFDVPPTQITPVVHPQSIVHSMVTWNDGSTVAQASYPDMKIPIALGLDWNWHHEQVGAPLRWNEATTWTFEPVDHETFPALAMAHHCLQQSGTHPAVLNAANEVCVDAFLDGRIKWLQITDTVAKVVDEHQGIGDPSLEDILNVQEWASRRAAELVGSQEERGSGQASSGRSRPEQTGREQTGPERSGKRPFAGQS